MKNKKPKHTPGPLEIHQGNDYIHVYGGRHNNSDNPLASFARLPDAKLFAAAPELLALCKETLEAVDLDGQNRKDLRKAIQAAIAKAEGR